MSRPIDADALVEQLFDKAKEMLGIAEQCQGAAINYYTGAKYGFAKAAIIANGLLTIDAVPVVRCKDCKHYEFADNRAFGMPVKRCEWTGFEDVDDNDFCSRGERSEE